MESASNFKVIGAVTELGTLTTGRTSNGREWTLLRIILSIEFSNKIPISFWNDVAKEASEKLKLFSSIEVEGTIQGKENKGNDGKIYYNTSLNAKNFKVVSLQ